MSARLVLCSVCGKGPSAADGGVALFSIVDSAGIRTRYCAEHVPADEMQRRIERHQRGDVLLDAGVLAVFKGRAESAQ